MSPSLARTEELTNVLSAILLSLKENSINYCVLRNHEELPAYTKHDVDILVSKIDLKKSSEAIFKAATSANWQIAAEVSQLGCRNIYMYCDTSETVQYLSIDILWGIFWGWMEVCDSTKVLAETSLSNDIPIASPSADAAIRLIKEISRGKKIKQKDEAAILNGFRKSKDDFCNILETHISKKVIEDVTLCIDRNDFNGLSALVSNIQKDLLRNHFVTRPFFNISRMLRYIISRIVRFQKGSLGLFVVLIGPDGAGKTTLLENMSANAGKLLFRGTKTLHTYFGIMPRLRHVARSSTGMNLEEPDYTQKHSGSNVKPHHPLRQFAYLSYYCWDYFLGRLVIKRSKGLSQLIIADRYFYDRYYQKAASETPWRMLDFFRHFAPKPDIILSLKADPKSIYERKHELTVNEIERQIDSIEKFRKKIGNHIPVEIIQTDLGDKVAENHAIRSMLQVLRDRNYGKQERILTE